MKLQEIKDFIKTCPYLANFTNCNVPRVSVDQLETDYINYVIQVNPVEPVVERFNDGSAVKRVTFDFKSNEFLDADTLKNIENNNFYENFADWLDKKTFDNELPEGWFSIEATSNGYLYNEIDDDHAIYAITVEVIYHYKKEA